MAVIVLYRTTAEASESYRSLLKARGRLDDERLDLKILLHDNSPEPASPGVLPPFVLYAAPGENKGLAGAYNRALSFALEEGYDWLLTLDQDTTLPENALELFAAALDRVESLPDVGAVVPIIQASGRTVSPYTFLGGAWARWIQPGFKGVPDKPVYAFNSGSLLRVEALRAVGGYSPWFWLDQSDAMIFHRLGQAGKGVYVASSLVLGHDFSMLNMAERVSPARYRNVLLAESAFWDIEMHFLAGMERNLRLLVRAVKHIARRDPPELRRITRQMLARRLFSTRARRLRTWREETEALLGSIEPWSPHAGPQAGRVPLLTIMAVVFRDRDELRAILDSIRPWKSEELEVVVIDGGSRDGTVELLEREASLVDYWRSEPDKGIYDAMNKGLAAATGDYILHLNAGDRLREPPWEILRACAAARVDVVCCTVLIDGVRAFVSGTGLLSKLDNTWHHQGTFYRRAAHLGYDTSFRTHGDFDHNQRLLKHGCSYRAYDVVIAEHASDGLTQHDKLHEETYRSVRKNFGWFYLQLSRLRFFVREMRDVLLRRG